MTRRTRPMPRVAAPDAAQQGAARLLRAAAQIAAQAQGERSTQPSRDLQVRRYNLLMALWRYRQNTGRGVMDEVL